MDEMTRPATNHELQRPTTGTVRWHGILSPAAACKTRSTGLAEDIAAGRTKPLDEVLDNV